MPLSVACTTEEKVPITANPQTAQGHAATIDGALTVEVLTGDGTFEQDPASPNMFFAVSGAGPGLTSYRISADANMQPGVDQVTTIQDTVDLTVQGANAAGFGLSAGTPVPK